MRADTNPYIQPLLVIKYAEIFGRLYDIEFATFNNVIRYVKEHNESFKPGAKIFINSLPGQHLNKEDMQKIYELAKASKDKVVVEFTEQSEIDDKALSDMKEDYESLGFETAVDDYGTGYSNVSNLLRYMPNYVKIDRALLANIQDSPQKQHFVKDIIEFSHDNNILALAEGIETAEEIATVIRLGIDLIQGYYTARPSEVICKEIDPEIKAEIIRHSKSRDDEVMRKEYVAGREARISLSQLEKEGYNTIRVTSGEVTHRDLVISGVPGDEPKIYLEIEDGYKGRILLENCEFTGKKRAAAIDIGKDCDVTISISGENRLLDGGIRIASTSNLMFEGDGKLNINITGVEAFGIGNDMDSYHGDIVFDQDGLIDITVNATKSVAIGSGLGGHISIRRGAYKLNLMGQQSVGIGSISGDIEPLVSNCALEIKSVALACVGIGSFLGRCDIMVEHSSINMDFFGNDVVLIGSKHSDKLQISIFSAAFTARARSHDITCIGSGSASPTVVSIDYLAFKVDLEGKQAGIYRGVDKNVRIRISNSQTSGSIVTSLGVPKHANDMDFKVNNSTVSLNINGQPMSGDHV
jgi:EAL domain-containing protein (putative c-di-GMP-specific phosphodiesterase class I)